MPGKWKRVYLSGPITKGDRNRNLYIANAAHKLLLDDEYAVLNPTLTMLHPTADRARDMAEVRSPVGRGGRSRDPPSWGERGRRHGSPTCPGPPRRGEAGNVR